MGTSNMQPGNRGKLMLAGIEVTGVRGAKINRNLRNAEGGGWGDPHDYAIQVQPGVPTIEVEDPLWDPEDDDVAAVMAALMAGGSAVAHLYAFGQDSNLDDYWTGTFILEDPSTELTSEDGIKIPFSLKSGAPDFQAVGACL